MEVKIYQANVADTIGGQYGEEARRAAGGVTVGYTPPSIGNTGTKHDLDLLSYIMSSSADPRNRYYAGMELLDRYGIDADLRMQVGRKTWDIVDLTKMIVNVGPKVYPSYIYLARALEAKEERTGKKESAHISQGHLFGSQYDKKKCYVKALELAVSFSDFRRCSGLVDMMGKNETVRLNGHKATREDIQIITSDSIRFKSHAERIKSGRK